MGDATKFESRHHDGKRAVSAAVRASWHVWMIRPDPLVCQSSHSTFSVILPLVQIGVFLVRLHHGDDGPDTHIPVTTLEDRIQRFALRLCSISNNEPSVSRGCRAVCCVKIPLVFTSTQRHAIIDAKSHPQKVILASLFFSSQTHRSPDNLMSSPRPFAAHTSVSKHIHTKHMQHQQQEENSPQANPSPH